MTSSLKLFLILYYIKQIDSKLPTWNVFDQIFHKKKFSQQKKKFILPTTDVLQW